MRRLRVWSLAGMLLWGCGGDDAGRGVAIDSVDSDRLGDIGGADLEDGTVDTLDTDKDAALEDGAVDADGNGDALADAADTAVDAFADIAPETATDVVAEIAPDVAADTATDIAADGVGDATNPTDTSGDIVDPCPLGTFCDDGDPCTHDDACVAGGTCVGVAVDCSGLDGVCAIGTCQDGACVAAILGGSLCDDGDLCTHDDACNIAGQCVGVAKNCSGLDGACTSGTCHAGSCVATIRNGSACDDGDGCTHGDACDAAGICSGSAVDCSPFETACASAACVGGICRSTATTGTSCNDGTGCTVSDQCTAGASCVGTWDATLSGCSCTTNAGCDDGLGCTTDTCLSGGACSHQLVAGQCLIDGVCYADSASRPGNLCQLCDATSSAGTWTNKSCTASTSACQSAVCEPANGCVTHNLTGTTCADNDACTGGDICQAGVCKGANVDCSDRLACTTDACTPGSGACAHALVANTCLIDGVCYANNAARPGDSCQICNPSVATGAWSPRTCAPATNACQSTSCEAANGCVTHNLTGTACNDNDACTGTDLCQAGVCRGTNVDCSDGRSCTTDACTPGTGACTHVLVSGQCLIGGVCYANNATQTGDLCQLCDAQRATAAWSPRVCPAASAPCQSTTCQAAQGCVAVDLSGGSCVDGNACTSGDTCASGKCVGTPVSCDDALPCTDDLCTSNGSCSHTLQAGQCISNNSCIECSELAFQSALALYNGALYPQAIAAFEAFLVAYPASVRADNARYLIARSHYQLADFATAASLFEAFLIGYPTSVLLDQATYFLGRSLFELGDMLGAADRFDELLALYPTSVYVDQSLYWAGRSHYELGVASTDPASPEFGLAEALFVRLFNEFPGATLEDNARYYYGMIAYQRGDYPVAATRLADMRIRFPASTYANNAWYFEARSHYRQLLWLTAATTFEAMLLAYPVSTYSDDAIYYAGRSRYELGRAGSTADYLAAIAHFDRIIADFLQSPYADNAYYYMIRCDLALGDCAAASTDLQAMRLAFPPINNISNSYVVRAEAAYAAAGCVP